MKKHQAYPPNILQPTAEPEGVEVKWENISGLYLQITEVVGAIVNLVDAELKNVSPSALQMNAVLSTIRVRSRCKA